MTWVALYEYVMQSLLPLDSYSLGTTGAASCSPTLPRRENSRDPRILENIPPAGSA
jgi:hypothetical protein